MDETAEISIVREDGKVTVVGGGFLDFLNAREFKEGLADAAATADEVVVDLRNAVFIDTAILEYIAAAGKKLLDRQKRLKVVATRQSQPLRVVEMVGLGALMDIEASPAAEPS